MTSITNEPHVAVLAFPFGTHAAPLLTVIRCLSKAAPNVHFSFFNTAESNTMIFSNSNNDAVKAYNVSDGVPDKYVFTGKHQENIELFMKAAPENFWKGIEAAVAETGRKVSCLVTDGFFWFAAEMAEEMGVPWVPFWAGGPHSLSTHVLTDFIRDKVGAGGIGGREEEPLTFIPGMSKLRLRDLPEGILAGNLNSIFSTMLHKMGKMLPQATAVFINFFEELDPTLTNDLNSKFKKFLNVGPFNLLSLSPPPSTPDANNCLSWLNDQKAESVAYISFGRVATPPPTEILAIADALEASGVAFLWSLKDHSKVHLPKGFLDKTRASGMVVPWAPQLQILAHGAVGVFVTHCGWNSVLESIGGGVPMICRPFFGDHKVNTRMVEAVWEIGIKIDGEMFTKNGLISSLDLVLSQEKGKKMRGHIRGLKGLAEKAVGPQGSSTKNLKTLLSLVSRPKDIA
uniref:Glycosyltransferase n=1 Tax=Paeonia delavayi TaxID=40707 RepID=A0A1V0CH65_9MAGN|nr:UDP-glucose flavonoid 3-O-glucosyltransferase [Paeonia delavayi]